MVSNNPFQTNNNSRKILSAGTTAANNKTNKISDYFEHEKEDLTKIPLYKILKIYNLQ